MKKLVFAISILVAGVLASCGQKAEGKFPGYTKVEDGLFIKFLNDNAEGKKIQVGDIVSVNMKYATESDSVLFETQPGGVPVQLKADTGAYVGDFMGSFLSMKEGDSVSVLVNADTFFIKTARMPESPEFIDSASMLYFTLKILKVQTMEEMQAEQEAKNATLENEEQTKLQQYLTDNNITATPTASGMYFISEKKGSGKAAAANKKVRVNYAGMLLDGTYFDTSMEDLAKEQGMYDERRAPYKPIEFTLGQGQVIPGWDEGISMMKEGGKAKLIIPSNLAYGANPRPGGVIKPFSTLVFNVELVEVID